jgi:hypothetical protein
MGFKAQSGVQRRAAIISAVAVGGRLITLARCGARQARVTTRALSGVTPWS